MKVWLQSIGLSEAKSELKDVRQGFNFLDFQVILVRKTTVGRYKIKIIPNKAAQANLLKKVRFIIQSHKAASSYILIRRLSPVIIGWANRFKYCECSKIFSKMDHLIFLKLRAWVFRRDTKNSRTIVKQRYFPSGRTYLYAGVNHKDNWVLVGKTKGNTEGKTKGKDGLKTNFLPRMSWIHSEKHVKVKQSKSPYDNDKLYWSLRLKYTTSSLSVRKLLRRQNGNCNICRKPFDTFSSANWEIDHVIPKSCGGEDTYTNLQLVHKQCHLTKSATEAKERAQTRAELQKKKEKRAALRKTKAKKAALRRTKKA